MHYMEPTRSRRVAARTVGLFRPHKWLFLALVVVAAAGAALQLLPVLVIARIVNEITPEEIGGQAVVSGDVEGLLQLVGIATAMYVASGLLTVLRSYITQVIGQDVMYGVRERLHDHLQKQSLRFHTENQTGEILSRVTTDVNQVEQAVTITLADFFVNIVTLVIALGMMFVLDWRLALVAMLVLPFWILPTKKVGEYQRRLRKEWQEETAAMSSHLEETLSVSGAMLVKSFGRQEYEAERFANANARLRLLSIQRVMAGRWFNMATELFGSLALIAVFAVGGIAVLQGGADLGTVVAFSVLVQKVFQPFATVARVNTTLISSLALFERIFDYLDRPIDVVEPKGVEAPRDVRGHIRFEDVTFAYADTESPALDRVTIDVKPGQMAALVGPSGAGKTTMAYLLQRFYDPQQGSVRIDGHDLRDLSFSGLASTVGAVMQETFLFHTTLRENIRYGRLDASDEELLAAARIAGLTDMLEGLPDGLDTVVGERGYRLSGGQKQRVAIARAILKDPPVLVFDEATASLDTRLEREIREATAQLARGRTTVVIAHRLSTVLAADVIYVFEHGRVVEQGRHDELLARDGLYAALYREQFAETNGNSTDGNSEEHGADERIRTFRPRLVTE
ncbi:MAG: ABC transporter ATP-binding protein [Dehalococcoidia bacterium]|nr:ABC transporter ATP-binding protein [Dehalococcoidia bacterium]MCA9856901.1 ABC transporter ATP-binding protein [Dehalococcoidia bacterium]